ncbi:putative disease resistance RPP13-like protein 2 isoform X2 [Sorghum bicolor]|uniref:putative disease resistance RPP13-like protein 2 isoform X2 n=1 Tax=Sorghum bicolor TaxID=4558 RepID=UPI000B425FA1|nr:putative disease resistance RPP13-like protein 2 isoform X2 [Sorghum bicolor]|eukprot:XP_021316917.1 putative disease resistance RPP13-like protein 2 isoform X2 [Sorghum bicolor]
MDGFMASAATGAMSSLLAKLAELLGEDYNMQRGMRREIAFLKDELSSMNTLLERLADSEMLDLQTKEWRDQVREMSYDIEDCVDDYMRQLQNEPQRHSGVVGFFFGYVQKVKDLITRHEIAEQIQELKARIVEVGHRRKRYKIDDTVNFGGTNVIPVDRRLPALYAELGGLVGISVPRDEVIKLVDDGAQGVKVVSIVGCGGLGKTTIANQVYINIAEKFDCQAFVSLTQNPDMVIIFQSILTQVKKDECDSTSSCDKELLISELRDFLKDKRLEKNCDVEEMNMILSLSYNHLPHHLKTCLLYLSMFPEDYVIKRDYLVRRWVAEGFISAHGRKNLEDEGECYFNELINRSLIQPVDFQYDGRVYTCRVHDVILDLITCKAVEENFVTVVTNGKQMLPSHGKVHRLSLEYHGLETLRTNPIVTTHVRSLDIFRYSEEMLPLSGFRSLRVLDLDGNENLESCYLKDIGKLYQLRYLRIKASNITLPESIGELQCLVILDLVSCLNLGELPTSIVELRHLKWLIVPRMNLPDGVGNMQALEFLSLIVVDYTISTSLLQELGSLTKLRTLELDWRINPLHRDKKTYEDNFVSSLGKLGSSNLRYLKLISPWSLDFLLEPWSPTPHLLQELVIKGWHLNKIPVWMVSLTNLTYLDVEVKVRQETLQILGDFPALQFLKLCSNAAGSEVKCLVVSNSGFRCLKKFSFVGWVNMMFKEGAVPVLETLEFQIIVHEVQTACRFGPPDFGISHLSTLRNLVVNVHCEGSRVKEVEALEAAIRSAASMLPNHPTPALHRFLESELVKE